MQKKHKAKPKVIYQKTKQSQGYKKLFFQGMFLATVGVLVIFFLAKQPSQRSVIPTPQTHKVLGVGSFLYASPSGKVVNVKLSQRATVSPTPSPKPSLPPVSRGFCLNVPVLFYHHIEPIALAKQEGHAQLTVDSSIFDQQMAYLVSKGYHAISSNQLVSSLLAHQQLPSNTVVLTFDDGYSDIYAYAFPIIKKYNLTADLMIPSGLVMNSGYLTWTEIKDMLGAMHVYNHTWSHASLGGATKEKIEFELTTSQNQLQSQLGTAPNIFTYPYGSFGPLAIQRLHEHGFIAGFSTLPGSLQCESFIMTLHRTRIGNAMLSMYGL